MWTLQNGWWCSFQWSATIGRSTRCAQKNPYHPSEANQYLQKSPKEKSKLGIFDDSFQVSSWHFLLKKDESLHQNPCFYSLKITKTWIQKERLSGLEPRLLWSHGVTLLAKLYGWYGWKKLFFWGVVVRPWNLGGPVGSIGKGCFLLRCNMQSIIVERAPKSCFNFMFVYSLLPQFVTILGLESCDMFSRLLQDIEKPTWLFFCKHISKMFFYCNCHWKYIEYPLQV